MAGKVLANVMLIHLLVHIVDLVIPESQCSFWRGHSSIDIFVVLQLQKKYHEQHHELCMVFVDLIKTFNTVNSELRGHNSCVSL